MSSFEIFWLKSCANQRIPSEYAEKWLKSIQTKYNTESSRIYHNSNVLIKKCDFLDSLCASNSIAKFDDYLIFAIAFQYYHFDLKTDYVDRNCIAFREMCDDASVSDAQLVDSVCHMLGDSTKLYAGNEHDVELFRDLDLIILGSSPSEYKVYQVATQNEYSHLDDTTYKQTRLRILETFLQIPQIYSVPCVSERLEQAARANIKQEITELKN